MKSKIKMIAAGVVAVVLVAGLAVNIVMNYKTNKSIDKLEKLTKQLSSDSVSTDRDVNEDDYEEEDWSDEWEEEEDYYGDVEYEEGDYYHENGELIEIADEYKIRDFDYIAQAYLTGDESLLESDADKETLELAAAVLEEIITEDMTLYEKELAIHDWLCENVSFDGDSLSALGSAQDYMDTPYGVLKYHMGVCVGYATTFRLLTTMAGMECDIIHDTEYSHTWNVIKLEDGEYYLVDVYSDVVGDGTVLHTYFNVNEDTMYNDWDYERYPRAYGTEYSYANMNKVALKSTDELIEKLTTLSEEGGELYFTMDSQYTAGDVFYILDGVSMRINNNYDSYCEYNVGSIEVESPVYSVYVMVYDYEEDWGDGNWEDTTIDTNEVDTTLDELFGYIDEYTYY